MASDVKRWRELVEHVESVPPCDPLAVDAARIALAAAEWEVWLQERAGERYLIPSAHYIVAAIMGGKAPGHNPPKPSK